MALVPTYVNASSNAFQNVTSATLSHTIASNPYRILIVGVTTENNPSSTNGIITGVTYAGIAMTKVDDASIDNGASYNKGGLWYLVNPPVGTANIVASFQGNSFSNIVSGLYYYNVKQGAPNVSSKNTGSSNNPNTALTTTKDGCIVVDVMGDGTGSNLNRSPATGTERIDTNDTVQSGQGMSEILKTTAGAETRSWNLTSNPRWLMVVAAFEPYQQPAGSPMFFGGGLTIG